jgi:Alpha-mannosidase
MWPWRDGAAEALTTMQSAVDRMRETPGFCFSHSSAMTYRWAQEMAPRLFDEIKERVNEGRWEVVNGWIVEPDCNIPSTESFVRQCMYGKRYFAEELGVDVTIGYNIDSFGHGAGLPQVLARAGFRYYVMMRPGSHEADLPPLFWWESADGSRVLTWRIPVHYGQGPQAKADDIEAAIRVAPDRCFAPGFDHGAFFLGIGNHGGGPTRSHLQRIVELQADSTLPELRFSTLGAFFREIERSPEFERIPAVKGELQHHARGCYSAMGEIKALNRRAERSLVKAETLAAVTGIDADLEDVWWKVLFNQFHDVLAGSALRSCYRDSRDSVGAACDTADEIAVRSLQRLARRVDTSSAEGSVLFLMNHLPWKRRAIVGFDTFTSPGGKRATHLKAADGTLVPVQWTSAEVSPDIRSWKRLTAVVELPACGYRVYALAGSDIAPGTPPLRECVLPEGQFGLASLPALDGTEMLAAPIGLVVVEDTSDTWAHGVDCFRTVLGRPTLESTEVVEDGPVVRVVRQKGRWRDSAVVLDIVTWQRSQTVELRLATNWQEPRQILKLEVPTLLGDVLTFASVPGGVAERPPDGGEEPCQDWVALQGVVGSGAYALGVVNDSTYSYDCLAGLLRLTCLRCVPYAEHDPVKVRPDYTGPYLDQGWQERRFWLVAGPGAAPELHLQRLADELQSPAEYVMDSAHPGTEPWERSLLSVGPDNISVLAVTRAAGANETIIRLRETEGRRTDARLVTPAIGLDFSAGIAPWEIQTFAIAEDGLRTTVREVGLLYQR